MALWNLLGTCAAQLGQSDQALLAFQEAININPENPKAHYNLGLALNGRNKLDEAAEAYKKAITINPDYAEAYSNLGNVLKKQGMLDEAIKSYQKAVSINPNSAETFNNMGVTFKDQGKLEKAIEAYYKALNKNPQHSAAWDNIFFALQAKKTRLPYERFVSLYPKDKNSDNWKINKSVLVYKLHRGHKLAEDYFGEVLKTISGAKNMSIRNPVKNSSDSQLHPKLIDTIVALVHFGRSGTGLMHSLIDGHSEVSTLPSIYFSEYFNKSTWDKIISGGWEKMPEQFIAIYDVLFDASSPVPVETQGKG